MIKPSIYPGKKAAKITFLGQRKYYQGVIYDMAGQFKVLSHKWKTASQAMEWAARVSLRYNRIKDGVK